MRRLLTILLFAALAAGCREDATTEIHADGAHAGAGTIRRGIGPECPDTWVIETSNGLRLWPVDDPAFQKEGLAVRYAAQEQKGMMSICQAGTMVRFAMIERR